MNKKILAAFLATLMLLSALVGCNSKIGDEEVGATADVDSVARVSMTLSLWLPTDEDTTEEAITLVEEAINFYTRAKFDTAIELNAIPRDEYQEKVDARLAEIEKTIADEKAAADKKKQELKDNKTEDKTESESDESEAETIVNDLGITISEYPEVGSKQFDIFLVQGYDKYMEYIDNNILYQLDDQLSSNSKILKQYIYPTFLSIANIDGTFAIPNNHPVGEYQYLLVNKELVDTYDYNPSDLIVFTKCEEFIKDMAFQNLDNVVPLLGPVTPANMVYWGADESGWSIIASQITNTMTYSTLNSPKNLITMNPYINSELLMKNLTELGLVGDGTLKEGEKFAVGVISGNEKTIAEYEDEYYINIYSKPMFDEEDIFGAMFGVSTYTKSLSRSMEIITYLNTSSDIRTILQYGVEGVHWVYEDEEEDDENKKTIRIISDDYKMNLVETGNVYMTYPGEGLPKSDWEYAKQQNLDSISNPYLRFPGYINEANEPLLEELQKLSKDIKARLDACPAADYKALVADLKKELKENEVLNKLLDTGANFTDSFVCIYSDWHAETYPTN